jgi:dCMP deaminase
MTRPSLDEYYLQMLPLVASRATCPRRSVAAILVDRGGKLVAIGYNGPPSGMPHCIDKPCPGAADASGNLGRCIAIHAEMNALSQARASCRQPHTLYCSVTPCFDCAKMLITEGIKRVVAPSIYTDPAGVDLLTDAKVNVVIVEVKNGDQKNQA